MTKILVLKLDMYVLIIYYLLCYFKDMSPLRYA